MKTVYLFAGTSYTLPRNFPSAQGALFSVQCSNGFDILIFITVSGLSESWLKFSARVQAVELSPSIVTFLLSYQFY